MRLDRTMSKIRTFALVLIVGTSACRRSVSVSESEESESESESEESGSSTEGDTEGSGPTDLPLPDLCDGIPTDLQSDIQNCGECGRRCQGDLGTHPMENAPCVEGECTPSWGGCWPAADPTTCDEICGSQGCVPEGCQGATLLVWSQVDVGLGSFSCLQDPTEEFEVVSSYSCSDPVPSQSGVAGGPLDYYTCCCGPSSVGP